MALFTATPSDGAIWITGGSSGIGAHSAIRLADEGFTVFVSAPSRSDLTILAKNYKGLGEIRALPLDVADRKACQDAVDKIREQGFEIAIVLFSAGIFQQVDGGELQIDSIENVLSVNFIGVLNCLVPTVEEMKRNGKGQIAVVASVSGYGGQRRQAAYSASKAALINMCESLKFDFDELNIKIQVINPGFIDTPMTKLSKAPMPFLMPIDSAADRLVACLKKDMFEITFPRRFTWLVKFINLLPYPLYFWLNKRGSSRRNRLKSSIERDKGNLDKRP